MTDLERAVFSHEWDLPYDNAVGMVVYTTFQELATWLTYVNLRKLVQAEGGDPALERALTLVSVDERAHYDFFRKLVSLYLEHDRPGTLEQIRRVSNTFNMPALHMLADSRQRMEDIKQLRLFAEDLFVFEVYEPALKALQVTKRELRRRNSSREIMVVAAGR
jgi:acyl-[acyl-carrier-protein] desaturase